jgi:hypothetical protein
VVPPARSRRESAAGESGSAVVDFVLVGSLLVFLFLALLQLALALHVRNVLIDSAVLGARFGALSDTDPEAGAERTRSLIAEELSPGYAGQVSARIVELDGVTTVEVEVRAPVPVVGLIGVGRGFTVTGHALAEAP